MRIKIRMFSIVVLMMASFLLCNSCAVSGLKNAPTQFDQHSPKGLIVGSITFVREKPTATGYFFFFKSLDSIKKRSALKSEELYIAPHQTWKIKHSGELNGGRTYLFAIERYQDDYEVAYIRLASVGYGGTLYEYRLENFKIPITVKKGEILYMGELYFNDYARNNELPIQINDKFERDIQALKLRYPDLDWQATKKSDFKILYQ